MVDYSYHDIIEALGIELFSGRNSYPMQLNLTDTNIMEIIRTKTLPVTFLIGECVYFQSNECSHYLYNHLRSERIMKRIVEKNKFAQRYSANNNVFMHIRLGDSVQYTPGFKYFDKVLSSIQFDRGFVASDSPGHPMIQQLIEKYPTISVLNANEIDTILFGSTCKNVILSHGSFSAVIGYLSFHSKVYYPMYEEGKKWCGDMFSDTADWTRVEF